MEGATASPTGTRLYRAIERALRAQHPGSRVVPVLFPGGSDLRVARRLGGVGYGFGSFGRDVVLGDLYSRLHAHDEHIRLSDVDLTVRALAAVAADFLGAR